VLSATRSLDSTWIICFLCRLYSYLAFSRTSRRRQCLEALNGRVSTRAQDHDTGRVLLIVHMQLARAPHDLAVALVLLSHVDAHDDGLVHGIADDDAATLLAARHLLRRLPRGLRLGLAAETFFVAGFAAGAATVFLTAAFLATGFLTAAFLAAAFLAAGVRAADCLRLACRYRTS